MILEVLTSKVEILSFLTQLRSSSNLLLRRSLYIIHLSKGRTDQTLGPWFQQDSRNKLRNFPFINRDERIGLTKHRFMHHSESLIVRFEAKEDLASIHPSNPFTATKAPESCSQSTNTTAQHNNNQWCSVPLLSPSMTAFVLQNLLHHLSIVTLPTMLFVFWSLPLSCRSTSSIPAPLYMIPVISLCIIANVPFPLGLLPFKSRIALSLRFCAKMRQNEQVKSIAITCSSIHQMKLVRYLSCLME